MTRDQTRAILLAYRPWAPAPDDPVLGEALALARTDPELRAWFEAHCAFQQAMRNALRRTALPQALRTPSAPPRPLLRFPTLAAQIWRIAAAILILCGIGALLWHKPGEEPSFAVLRNRLVQSVLRGYPMDVVSTSDAALRSFLRDRQAPADYALRSPLSELPILGGGIRSWRDGKVAMVCLGARDQRTLFLFVADRSSVPDAPAEGLEWAQVKTCATVSWSEGDRSYVLALEAPPAELRAYVPVQ
jgi:hypothetical protein